MFWYYENDSLSRKKDGNDDERRSDEGYFPPELRREIPLLRLSYPVRMLF
jgi:hypothetical protein